MQSTPDEVLIGRIANGDALAMQVLYARSTCGCFGFSSGHRLIRYEATAEDVTGEVFLDVWRQADRFKGARQVSTWLLAIARFKAISALSIDGTRSWTKRQQPPSKICRTIPQLHWRRRIECNAAKVPL